MRIASNHPAQQAHRAAPVTAAKSAPVQQAHAPAARPAARGGDSISHGAAKSAPLISSGGYHPSAKVGGVKN